MLEEQGHLKLPVDIACLNISPLESSKQSSHIAAIGTWNNTVHILHLPSLQALQKHDLGSDVIPRSVLFATFEGITFLLVALGRLYVTLFIVSNQI